MIDDGVQQLMGTLGASTGCGTPTSLHLRQRLLLRRAPADRRQVPRLRAGDPPALPDPRPGSTGQLDRRAGGEHRLAPTLLELAGAEADKSIDGRSLVPFLEDPELRTRRPILFESFVETRRRRQRGDLRRARPASASARRAARGGQAHGLAPGAAQGLRGDPARPLQVHRLAERREGALRHQPRPLRAELAAQGPQLLPDPQLPAPRRCAARELRRRACQEVTPKLPLTRKEYSDSAPKSRRKSANGNGSGKKNGGKKNAGRNGRRPAGGLPPTAPPAGEASTR